MESIALPSIGRVFANAKDAPIHPAATFTPGIKNGARETAVFIMVPPTDFVRPSLSRKSNLLAIESSLVIVSQKCITSLFEASLLPSNSV